MNPTAGRLVQDCEQANGSEGQALVIKHQAVRCRGGAICYDRLASYQAFSHPHAVNVAGAVFDDTTSRPG